MDISEPPKVNCQTLRECVADLKKVLSPSELEMFTTTPRNKLIGFHFSLGLYIRNRYLYETPLLESMNDKLDFTNPDDISGLVVDMLWLSLNQVPCNQVELDKLHKHQIVSFRNNKPGEEELLTMFEWD